MKTRIQGIGEDISAPVIRSLERILGDDFDLRVTVFPACHKIDADKYLLGFKVMIEQDNVTLLKTASINGTLEFHVINGEANPLANLKSKEALEIVSLTYQNVLNILLESFNPFLSNHNFKPIESWTKDEVKPRAVKFIETLLTNQ